MIKLPKLSFNDLIQVQNYDSFKKLASPLINHCSSESILEKKNKSPRLDLNDDEELKSHDMSAFQSDQKCSYLHHRRSDSLQYSQHDLSEATRLPKLKLISESDYFTSLEN